MRKKTLITAMAIFCLTLLCGFGQSARAESVADGAWDVYLTPYGWFPSVSANVAVGKHDDHIEKSALDVMQKNSVLSLAARAEVWKGPLGFTADVFWLGLARKFQTSRFMTEDRFTSNQVLADFALAWRFDPIALGSDGAFPNVRFMVYAGGRLNYMNQKISVHPSGPILGMFDIYRDRFKQTSSFGPLVGAGAELKFTQKFSIAVRGDVGNFGLDNLMTWKILPQATYYFTDYFGLTLGYQVYGLNLNRYHNDRRMAFNGTQHGPMIGLVFHFF